jgi:hypothetical protein
MKKQSDAFDSKSDRWRSWEKADAGKTPSQRLRAACVRYAAHNDQVARTRLVASSPPRRTERAPLK